MQAEINLARNLDDLFADHDIRIQADMLRFGRLQQRFQLTPCSNRRPVQSRVLAIMGAGRAADRVVAGLMRDGAGVNLTVVAQIVPETGGIAGEIVVKILAGHIFRPAVGDLTGNDLIISILKVHTSRS